MSLKILLKAVEKDGKIDLWLSDNEGNIGVDDLRSVGGRGQKVKWKLAKDSNINKILNIYKKEDSEEVFSVKPHKVTDKKWKGVIDKDVEGDEAYNIDFEYKDGSKVSIDPVISVPPKD
ncbi:hypothetical protein [Saccharicrinis aurantiacus]|uniref:hypothetical protein n=1 Tax=Saccharicrinis aurantiacus TaxID=1849719 RepID=UPI00094FD61B|nr:hypothetical protein [Saccharicrinis aurantiacus]